MIRNAVQTNAEETRELFSPGLFLYLLLLGFLPSLFVAWIRVDRQPLRRALLSKLTVVGILLALTVTQLLAFNRTYASFFREHKPLRYHVNPLAVLVSAARYGAHAVAVPRSGVEPLGTDARIPSEDLDRELIIFVVGETARADHFSLNGYPRPTNPKLALERVISLTRMSACGTSTAVSLPCMFSIKPRKGFRTADAPYSENLLDVVTHAGVRVLWRDNNTGHKGIADRVKYQDFRSPDLNPVCDDECRDEGMLADLQQYVDGTPDGDILIVLHQMGNHGPAYYKRYPRAFERFSPVCRTVELGDCEVEEIANAYDNAILYTDHFLSQVIRFLEENDDRFETCLFYVSDHGESLGEHGLYLHGMPALMAPPEQTHVGAFLWFGGNFEDVDPEAVRALADEPYSHDHVFHTVLGLLEVESEVYDPGLDILALARAARE